MEDAFVSRHYFLRQVADVRDKECGFCIDIFQGELSVDVGDGSLGSSFYRNIGADDGFAFFIDNGS